jgi:hypothetical protein
VGAGFLEAGLTVGFAGGEQGIFGGLGVVLPRL